MSKLRPKLYDKKIDVQLKNIITGVTVRGDVISEMDIDGKPFWVFVAYNRPNELMFAKDAWSIVKGK
jgi:hypothetical protein